MSFWGRMRQHLTLKAETKIKKPIGEARNATMCSSFPKNAYLFLGCREAITSIKHSVPPLNRGWILFFELNITRLQERSGPKHVQQNEGIIKTNYKNSTKVPHKWGNEQSRTKISSCKDLVDPGSTSEIEKSYLGRTFVMRKWHFLTFQLCQSSAFLVPK